MEKSNKISQGREKGSPEDIFMSGDTPDRERRYEKIEIFLGETFQTPLKMLAPSAFAGITVTPRFDSEGYENPMYPTYPEFTCAYFSAVVYFQRLHLRRDKSRIDFYAKELITVNPPAAIHCTTRKCRTQPFSIFHFPSSKVPPDLVNIRVTDGFRTDFQWCKNHSEFHSSSYVHTLFYMFLQEMDENRQLVTKLHQAHNIQ